MQDSRPPKPGGVLEAALYVDDLEAARGFFGGLLGLEEVIHHPPRHVFFRCGTTIVLLFRADQSRLPPESDALPVPSHGASGPGHICFAANASQMEAWIETLTGAGVEIEADFRWPNGARSIYVRDPAGNSVEFAEPKLWEPAA